MDTIVLTEKLESLRRCVQRIKEKQPRHVNELKQNIDLQDILVLNLSRAIQRCVDIGGRLLSHTNCPAPLEQFRCKCKRIPVSINEIGCAIEKIKCKHLTKKCSRAFSIQIWAYPQDAK